jgi:hypothetical protein
MTKRKQIQEASDTRAPDAIAEEHRSLKRLLKNMESTADLRRLVPMLGELHDLLEEHFLHEEATDGLHATIGSSAPHHLTTLQNLFEEHQDFLDTLTKLDAQARACLDGPLAEILEGIESVSERLRRHEARETELLTDAMFVDLGDSS